MLKSLWVKNLALIEDAEVSFGPRFNVITGETGAGKSSFLTALKFILGERAESAFVRKGHEKALMGAIFDMNPLLETILDEKGIESEKDELFLKREISSSGKARAFVNNQPVLLSVLNEIGKALVSFASQQAHLELIHPDSQLKILDQHAEVDLAFYKSLWQQWSSKKEEKERLEKLKENLDFLLKKLQSDEALLQKSPLLEQDSEIFEQFKNLEATRESKELLLKLREALFSPGKNLNTLLNRYLGSFEAFPELSTSLKTLHAEAEELSYSLDRLLEDGFDEKRHKSLSDKLHTIDKLRAKWGNLEQCQKALAEVQKEITVLQNIDHELFSINEEIASAENKLQQEASLISQRREKSAKLLEKAVTKHLQELNMPSALFHIELSSLTLSSKGCEQISFFLTANPGERKTPLNGFASGGELSRLLLAIKASLGSADQILIFDEVDANIGGVTAVVVAQKLKSIAQSHQIIAITHLPQMALYADTHLAIEKRTKEGRTFTTVTRLSEKERKDELQRMKGHP